MQAELTLRTSHREQLSVEPLHEIGGWQQKKMNVQTIMGRGEVPPCVDKDISEYWSECLLSDYKHPFQIGYLKIKYIPVFSPSHAYSINFFGFF